MAEKKRRAKGAGSLRHLDGDRWQVSVNDKRLGRHSRVFRARNRTEAERKSPQVVTALIEDVERSQTTRDASREERRQWTVEQYFAHYFEVWAPYHLAATTRQRYQYLAKFQITPNIGQKKMAELTPSDLMRLYEKLGEEGASHSTGKALSAHTIWNTRVVIQALYTFAINVQGDFETNPAKTAKPRIAREGRRAPAVDVAEVERLIALARQDEALYPLVFIPVRLGTRRGETLGLRWSDIDFERKSVTVRRSVCQTIAEGVEVKSTKTKKVRDIPLDPDTLAELRTMMKAQKEQRLLHGQGWKGAESAADDYVCARADGSLLPPLDYANVYRSFANRHSCQHLTPHVLRHAWISQLIALGFDAVTIASMAGHSADVLLTSYAHAFDARKRAAIDALADARKHAQTGS